MDCRDAMTSIKLGCKGLPLFVWFQSLATFVGQYFLFLHSLKSLELGLVDHPHTHIQLAPSDQFRKRKDLRLEHPHPRASQTLLAPFCVSGICLYTNSKIAEKGQQYAGRCWVRLSCATYHWYLKILNESNAIDYMQYLLCSRSWPFLWSHFNVQPLLTYLEISLKNESNIQTKIKDSRSR